MLMTEKELNSYRLTSLEEPTDEMLSYIMKEAAAEAQAETEAAHKKLFAEIRRSDIPTICQNGQPRLYQVIEIINYTITINHIPFC